MSCTTSWWSTSRCAGRRRSFPPPAPRSYQSRAGHSDSPANPPAAAASHSTGNAGAPDRRRGEHEVVGPQRRHGAESGPRVATFRHACGCTSGDLRQRIVSRVPDGVARRRPGDAVRVVLALLVIIALSYHAFHPTVAEKTFADWLRDLPDDAEKVVLVLYDLLALWAVAIVVTALLFLRRWRLARDLALAALVAWVGGRLLAFVVRSYRPRRRVRAHLRPHRRARASRSCGSASPPRWSPWRRRTSRGRRDGSGRGWCSRWRWPPCTSGAPCRPMWSPPSCSGGARPPRCTRVRHAGPPAHRHAGAHGACRDRDRGRRVLRAAVQQPVGRAMFVAQGADGPLRVVALGRDEADAQFLARMWRWIAYRDAPPTLFPTRRRQIEYEADVMRRAADGGARVPAVRWAGQQGSLALLVVDEVEGTPLRDVDRRYRRGGGAHRRVACRPAAIHRGRVSPTGASTATTSWSTARRSPCRLGAGVERGRGRAPARVRRRAAARRRRSAAASTDVAVDAAVAHVDHEQLADALPLLQPGALAWVTRDVARRARGRRARRAPHGDRRRRSAWRRRSSASGSG